mmetsp:Transcript_28248/g.52046  ORF Transcript_28248/g.52046 Transcript_28248/m.52046 type:complete len:386 (-) Transcript_28248:6-1163(-)
MASCKFVLTTCVLAFATQAHPDLEQMSAEGCPAMANSEQMDAACANGLEVNMLQQKLEMVKRSPISTAVAKLDAQGLHQIQSANAALPSDSIAVVENISSSTDVLPKMFVAVLTARSYPIGRRDAIRDLWKEVDDDTGFACTRFVICIAGMNETEETSWLAESQQFGDILFLPCDEGYAGGLLTKKLIALMKNFRHSSDQCLKRPLMMKVDDDTFVNGHKFRKGVREVVQQFGTDNIYAGVQQPDVPAPIVFRDPDHSWYEPLSAWPEKYYPPSMFGGPGYVLSRNLIEKMLDEQVAESHVLYNEDKAVGAWVHLLKKRGTTINFVNIKGINGYRKAEWVRSGFWKDYPFILQHYVSPELIRCMTRLDRLNMDYALLDPCFMDQY